MSELTPWRDVRDVKDDKNAPWRSVREPTNFSFGEMVSNIPSSFGKLVSETTEAVMHPIDTGEAVLGLGKSVLEKTGRKFEEFATGDTIAPDPGEENAANAFGAFVTDRYGSFDAFKKTLMEDPVGVGVDLSALGMMSKVKTVANVARASEPYRVAGGVIKNTVGRVIPENVAQKIYQSAAKFSTTFDPKKTQSLIQTALDYGVMPTAKGVAKVENKAGILRNQIDSLIDMSVQSGELIPVSSVFRHIGQLKAAKGGFKIDAGKDLNTIQKIEDSFRAHVADKLGGRKHVTPKEMQDFKTDAYSKIDWGKKKKATKNETYQAIGRAAKEEVATKVPEVADLNKELGRLLELQKPLAKAATRVGNHNLLSLGTHLKIGAGAGIGTYAGSPVAGTAIALTTVLLEHPRFRSRVAIVINKLKSGEAKWINDNINTPEVRVTLTMLGRIQETQEDK